MPLNLRCPRCGYTYSLNINIQNVAMAGAPMNIAVTCPNCGLEWDATEGGDGTFAIIGGQFVRVASHLASADSVQLAGLQGRLKALERERDERKAAEALTEVGVPTPKGGWLSDQGNRTELWTIVGMLIAVIALILSGRAHTS